MSRLRRVLCTTALIATAAAGAAAAPARAAITQREVSFAVTNTNATLVPCAADGRRYTVRGRLFLPDGPVPRSVGLYLHGLGHGAWFWHFTAVAGYDYATEQAKAGHASVVIDRLGYDASDHPAGNSVCVGSQATVAHQIVGALRNATYTAADAGGVPLFARVALAGHSLGGLIAEVEASTFQDVDGLLVVAFSDLLPSARSLLTFGQTAVECLLGGQPAEGPGTPGGYAPFGHTVSDFDAIMFYDAAPEVVAAANGLRNRDPCGDTSAVPAALVANALSLPGVRVPVLLELGANDALFTPPLANLGRLEFAGSRDVTQVVVRGTGHAVTLGRSAGRVRAVLDGWLTRHGF